MRLLLDENLSPLLVEALSELYPGSQQVHSLGLGGPDDGEVWMYAKKHGFAIVSKDSDFAERSVLEKEPPKIIFGSSFDVDDGVTAVGTVSKLMGEALN